MKVVAPGKVLLFGAYAVLEGARAIVVAVNRFAVADASRLVASASREVRAAIGDELAPEVDVTALYDGEAKLGLGSSAAVLVASLGARAALRGESLESHQTRRAIFDAARAAHATAQGGGSGVDVAASTYGGALAYAMADGGTVSPLDLPRGLELRVFWSGASARTSDLVARVRRLRERDRARYDALLGELESSASDAIHASSKGDLARFLAAAGASSTALASLGNAADAPIVPPAFADLASLAAREGAVFFPSGAGGGDVGAWLGSSVPSQAFISRADALGMTLLDIGIDSAGVRLGED